MKLRSNSPLKTSPNKHCGLFCKTGHFALIDLDGIATLSNMESYTVIYQFKEYANEYGGTLATNSRHYFSIGRTIDANDATGTQFYNYASTGIGIMGTNTTNGQGYTLQGNSYAVSQEKGWNLAIVTRGKMDGTSDNVQTKIVSSQLGMSQIDDTQTIAGDNWGDIGGEEGYITVGARQTANSGSADSFTSALQIKVTKLAIYCNASDDSAAYLSDADVIKAISFQEKGFGNSVVSYSEAGVAQPQHEWLFNDPTATSIADTGATGGLTLTFTGSPYLGWVGDSFLRS